MEQIRAALGGRELKKVLDAVGMPYTLEMVAQLVGKGGRVAAVLPVTTPMPEGVRVKTTVFGRCHDVSLPVLPFPIFTCLHPISSSCDADRVCFVA